MTTVIKQNHSLYLAHISVLGQSIRLYQMWGKNHFGKRTTVPASLGEMKQKALLSVQQMAAPDALRLDASLSNLVLQPML